MTALHLASDNGHDEVVKALLSTKATVNTRDKVGVVYTSWHTFVAYSWESPLSGQPFSKNTRNVCCS